MSPNLAKSPGVESTLVETQWPSVTAGSGFWALVGPPCSGWVYTPSLSVSPRARKWSDSQPAGLEHVGQSGEGHWGPGESLPGQPVAQRFLCPSLPE